MRKNGSETFLPEKNIIASLPAEPKQEAARDTGSESRCTPGRPIQSISCGFAEQIASYYAMDLIGELLGGGGSSRLFQTLVKEKKLFSNIECYHFRVFRSGIAY